MSQHPSTRRWVTVSTSCWESLQTIRTIASQDNIRDLVFNTVIVPIALSVCTALVLQTVVVAPIALLRILLYQTEYMEQLEANLTHLTKTLPMYVLVTLHTVYPKFTDRIFFTGMRLIGPAEVVDQLKAKKRVYHTWSHLKDYGHRTMVRLQFTVLASVARSIPMIGPLIMAALSFYFSWKTFGLKFSALLALLSLHPWTLLVQVELIETFQDLRWMAREVLEAYFAREAYKPKQKRLFLKTWGWYAVGMMIPCVLAMRVFWWTGVASFLWGQMVIAKLVVLVLESKWTMPAIEKVKKQ
jgi:hypothetical protein